MISANEFNERLARVRERFASALDGKIADSFAALDVISGGGDTIEVVVVAHRRLHEMCGTAPTLGFTATGNAARAAETTMRMAAKTKRALTPGETAALKSNLEVLNAAAINELKVYTSRK